MVPYQRWKEKNKIERKKEREREKERERAREGLKEESTQDILIRVRARYFRIANDSDRNFHKMFGAAMESYRMRGVLWDVWGCQTFHHCVRHWRRCQSFGSASIAALVRPRLSMVVLSRIARRSRIFSKGEKKQAALKEPPIRKSKPISPRRAHAFFSKYDLKFVWRGAFFSYLTNHICKCQSTSFLVRRRPSRQFGRVV